tara:strand:+ start:2309 stop:2644 length:336 start_codon:yes stop_codon:yes gene_type:complete
MAEWIDVCKDSDFEDNTRKLVELDDTDVLIFKIDNNYYAVDHFCTHADYELDDGEVDLKECNIKCPLHDAKFCLKTGKALTPPAFEDLPIYKVRIHESLVQIWDEPEYEEG